MRKPSNLKSFPHVQKNGAEKKSYTESLRPKISATVEETSPDSFDDTTASGQSDPQDVPRDRKPYSSTKTKFVEGLQSILPGSIVTLLIAFMGWISYTLINQGNQISAMSTSVERNTSDLKDLHQEYSKLNDQSIQTATILQQAQKETLPVKK